jgi:PAS domain S-box-containing protein
MYELYGVDKKTFNHSISSWIALVQPNDQKVMLNSIKQLKGGKGEFDIDIGISKTDDSIQYIKVLADVVNGTNGKPLRLVGSNWDITDQKLAENELLRKNQLLNVAEKISMIGIWQWDLITNAVQWSHNLYHIFGVKENSDIFFDTYFSFVHPEDKERVAAHIEKSLQDKFFVDLVHRIQLTDGTVKIIQLFAEIITDNDGNAVDMIGSCQDVTEQRMAEQKFRGLLESAPDAMVIINESYRIELVNSQTEHIFGYAKTDLVGQSVKKLIPKIIQQDGTLVDPTSLGIGGVNDLIAIKKNGEEFPSEINLGKLDTAEGLLISVAIRDVSIRKKTEATLRKMAALKAKNEEMEQLTYITSHDLREPILTVKKYAEVLKEDFFSTLGDEGKLLLNTIIRSVDRMDARINGLLDYAQLGQAKSLHTIDSNEVINLIVEDLNSLIETNHAKVTASSLPEKLKAYPTEFSLIFQNLINNAIKFKKPDTAPVVTISSNKLAEGWEFEVSDNGIGIQEKDFEKIFSIFQRLHNTSEYEGTGIGLAQVKKLVELHNGKIHVKSEYGKGTTFVFSILTENL